jgi:site-specific DNA recombinase
MPYSAYAKLCSEPNRLAEKQKRSKPRTSFRRKVMHTLAALYARVSTLQQEQEATIDSQVAALESYAQVQGYPLSREFYFLDQSVSGAQLDRPALNRLRDLAPEGLFSVVLCLSPDRLARQYAHQWVLMNELQRVGVQVIFINQPQMEANPHSQLLLGVQGLFAEYERALITERLRRGKLYRVRQGRLVNPVAPYGYRYIPVSEPDGGRWEIDPLEAQVVQQIYQWYTQESEITIRDLVTRLNQMGTAAPPRGCIWQYSTVQAILKQPDYTGQAYYNRTQAHPEEIGRRRKIGRGYKTHPIRLPRPQEEWIPIRVPEIISADTWQRAQERLAMRKKFAQRNNAKNFYLLRSLLVCQVCGHTLVGNASQGRKIYRCNHGGRLRSPDVAQHSCILAAEVVEPLVWQAVIQLLDNPRLMLDAWQSQADSTPPDPGENERVKNRLKTLERQWQRLLDLFQEELIEKAELAHRKAQLDQERETIQKRLEQIERQMHQDQTKEKMIEDFSTFCRQVKAGLANPTPEDQQEIIRLLIDHVVVGKDEIVIKHIVPTDDDFRLLPGRRYTRILCKKLTGILC